MEEEARRIETAVQDVLRAGIRTKDLHREGTTLVGTAAMGDEVVKRLTDIQKACSETKR
jgi:3-isopropylmalate dehydrogenase